MNPMPNLSISRDHPKPLSDQIADRYQQLIERGTLASGTRIPSVREASKQFGVSPGTVVEAYRILQQRNLVRSRPQSGYFVSPCDRSTCEPPRRTRPKLRILDVPAELSQRLHDAAGQSGVIGLGANIPNPDLMPMDALAREISKAYRDPGARPFSYGPMEGTHELRAAIARQMVSAGCSVAADEIVITNGATEAINLALLATTKPGDVIAVESPTYHGFLELIGGLGLRILPIDSCTVDGISVSALERALRARSVTAVLLIASFTNPLGGVLSIEDRKRLVELASEHDIVIIEDNVYGDLAFDGSQLPAIKAFDTEGRVVHCSSFSKTLSPGLRLGWCVPGRHHNEVVHAKHRLNVATPVAPQLAVARYLSGSGYERHLRRLRSAYAEQVEAMTAQVLASFPEGTRVSQPQGGSVLWVEMPEGYDALRLFHDAEAVGIAVAPGPLFDPESNYANCIRLNCSHPWSPQIAGAVARLGHLLDEQRQEREGGSAKAKRKPISAFRTG